VVTAEDFKPYPGNFLMDDLPERAFRSHVALALDYLAQGDSEAARQTLMNLALLDRLEQAGAGVYEAYRRTVSLWQALQQWLAAPEVAAGARQALWGAA
jgi:Tfp pilus assembly protein PilF